MENKTYICDRCGKRMTEFINVMVYGMDLADKRQTAQLCPKCAERLVKFLEPKAHK